VPRRTQVLLNPASQPSKVMHITSSAGRSSTATPLRDRRVGGPAADHEAA
jgi:hypothetical protein